MRRCALQRARRSSAPIFSSVCSAAGLSARPLPSALPTGGVVRRLRRLTARADLCGMTPCLCLRLDHRMRSSGSSSRPQQMEEGPVEAVPSVSRTGNSTPQPTKKKRTRQRTKKEHATASADITSSESVVVLSTSADLAALTQHRRAGKQEEAATPSARLSSSHPAVKKVSSDEASVMQTEHSPPPERAPSRVANVRETRPINAVHFTTDQKQKCKSVSKSKSAATSSHAADPESEKLKKRKPPRRKAKEEAAAEDPEATVSFDLLERIYPTAPTMNVAVAAATALTKSSKTLSSSSSAAAAVPVPIQQFPLPAPLPLKLPPADGTTPTSTSTSTTGTTAAPTMVQFFLKDVFLHPFSGKLTKPDSASAAGLYHLGFFRNPANPLQLSWSAEVYFRHFHQATKKLLQKNKKKKTSNSSSPPAITTEMVLKELFRPLKSSSVWCRDLKELFVHPDLLTVLPQSLAARYRHYVQAYMPAKLDTPPDPAVAQTVLTPDQSNVAQLALRGYHLYIGGSAGTGKTVLLKSIFRTLSNMGLRVAITATTGVAAVQLGGTTFHSAFNVPIAADAPGSKSSWDVNALRAIDVLIIDEVSLMDASLLDSFDMEARLARMSHQPFGGIQTIICGDFLQLSFGNESTKPAYQAECFSVFLQLRLVTPMRFSVGDPLLELLSQLRRGDFDAAQFQALDRPVPEDATNITYVYPLRKDAQLFNAQQLERIQTPEMAFAPQRGPLRLFGRFTPSAHVLLPAGTRALPAQEVLCAAVQEEVQRVCPQAGEIAAHDCVAMPARTSFISFFLRLRCPDRPTGEGASAAAPHAPGAAALTAEQWKEVAGRVAERVGGHVVAFYEEEPPAMVPLSVTMSLADMTNLNTAEALSILKLKLGCRVMINRNLSRTVSNGSVGVVEAYAPPDYSLFPHRYSGVVSVSRHKGEQQLFPALPVIRLLTGEVVQVPPLATTLGGTLETYYYAHDVYTLPLQLGYAFTVHKVQGLTLQGTVVVDCKRFFACPHLLYVACSRVRQLDQLIVLNVKPNMVIVKKDALQFSDGLMEARDAAVLSPPPSAVRAAWVVDTVQRVLQVAE